MNPSRVVVLLVGLPGLTFAQVCSDIEDDGERLACYDATSTASTTVPDVPPVQDPLPAPAAQPPATSAPVETPKPEPEADVRPAADQAQAKVAAEAPEDFGKQEPLDAPREYIEASIVEVTSHGGVNHFRLDNGQVWRENGYSNKRYKEGRKVTITEGVLNSYDLQVEGYTRIIKVKRVR
jgi:hypothetical protein